MRRTLKKILPLLHQQRVKPVNNINKLWIVTFIFLFSNLTVTSQEIKRPSYGYLRSTLLYTDHWAYNYIQLLQDRGYLRELYYSVKPYNRTDIAASLISVQDDQLPTSEKYWVTLLKDEFSLEIRILTEKNDNPEAITKFKTEFEAKSYSQHRHFENDAYLNPEIHFSTEHIAISARGRIDNGLLNDPSYTGRKTDLLGARLEDGYGILYFGKINLFIGRIAQNWGPFPKQSLILSDNPYTYDQIGLNFMTKHVAFHSTFAKLNPTAYNSQQADRYFSAHRLDLKFNNGINLGFSETVIYGGPGQSIEFSYMSPFSIFMNTQTNDHKEANENLAFDFYIPLGQFNLTGQILVDDFILDGPDRPAPNRKTSSDRLGFLLGILGNDLIMKHSQWAIRYERIGSYTYNVKQKRPWQSYTHDGRGLGSESNDHDTWEMNIKYFPVPKWIFDMDASFSRQGSRSLSSNDFEDSTFVKLPFPSGIIEKTVSLSAGTLYQHTRSVFAEARIGVDHVLNYNHIKTNNRTSLYLLLRMNFMLDHNIIY